MSVLKLRLAIWLGSVAVESLCGCASYGSHLTATPIAPDGAEASFHADAVILDRGLGPQALPNPELGFRLGYSEDVDFGGRLNVAGGELNTRLRLLRSKGADFTLSPYVGAGFVPLTNRDTGILRAPLGSRLILGLHASPKTQVMLALSGAVEAQAPLPALRGHTEDLKFLLTPACTVGVDFPWGSSLRVHPEINFVLPYDPANRGVYDADSRGFQEPIVQAGIALKWPDL